MKLKSADPFSAMVDFMAFMVLISIFLFIVSESIIPIDKGSEANVFSYRVTTKSAIDFSHELLVSEKTGPPMVDVEFSLWIVEANGNVRLGEKILKGTVINNDGNQSELFGVAPEEEPSDLLLSFSHLENLDLIGTFVEIAIDVQFGKKSCSIEWSGQLGIDPGIHLDFDKCNSS